MGTSYMISFLISHLSLFKYFSILFSLVIIKYVIVWPILNILLHVMLVDKELDIAHLFHLKKHLLTHPKAR
jgi:hypothetical protein